MIDTLPPVILSRPEAVRRRATLRRRRRALAVVGLVLALAITTTAAVVILPVGSAAPFAAPFATTSAEGWIPEGEPVGLDADIPAIQRLDPALRDALAAAADAASVDGLPMQITSGWRSAAYQQSLFDDAVAEYGEETARQLVATPETSSHVTGRAVDVGPLDTQLWLMQYGADYGLCQIYANERWHWELATTPGGTCPEMLPDASAPR